MFSLYAKLAKKQGPLTLSEVVQPWILVSFLHSPVLPQAVQWTSRAAGVGLIWLFPICTVVVLGGRYPVASPGLIVFQSLCLWSMALICLYSILWVTRRQSDIRALEFNKKSIAPHLPLWVTFCFVFLLALSLGSSTRWLNLATFANPTFSFSDLNMAFVPEGWVDFETARARALSDECKPFPAPEASIEARVRCSNEAFSFFADRRRSYDKVQKVSFVDHGAFPEGTVFGSVQATGVDMRGIVMIGADFHHDREQGSIFEGANFQGAKITGADLFQAQFQLADLRGSDFAEASLRSGEFQFARLSAANFSGADLGFSDLSFARISDFEEEGWSLDLSRSVLIKTETDNIYASNATHRFDLSLAYVNGTTLPENRSPFLEGQLAEAIFTNYQPHERALTVENLLDVGVTDATGTALRFVDLEAPTRNGGAYVESDGQLVLSYLLLSTTFGDGSVKLPNALRSNAQIDPPCQWSKAVLSDLEYFGHWRGWLESGDFSWPPSDVIGNLRARVVVYEMLYENPQTGEIEIVLDSSPRDSRIQNGRREYANSIRVVSREDIPVRDVPAIELVEGCVPLRNLLND